MKFDYDDDDDDDDDVDDADDDDGYGDEAVGADGDGNSWAAAAGVRINAECGNIFCTMHGLYETNRPNDVRADSAMPYLPHSSSSLVCSSLLESGSLSLLADGIM